MNDYDRLLGDLPKLNVGDELILRQTRNDKHARDVIVVVESIGRKWGVAAKPDSWQRIKFDLVTGLEDSGQYAARQRVLTAEMDLDASIRKGLFDLLALSGVTIEHSLRPKFNQQVLRDMITVLTEHSILGHDSQP